MANVGAPQVNYRESINKAHEIRYVHKKQSGGSGQFADVAIRFEPAEPGAAAAAALVGVCVYWGC